MENPCTNCTNPVAERRPSTSGTHWCKRPECQAAKQKFYRNRKAEEAERLATPIRLQLLNDVIRRERVVCSLCGLENALPGWAHRDRTAGGLTPCYGTGRQGPGLGTGYLDVIHPELVPTAATK